jgi:hypothetical protein
VVRCAISVGSKVDNGNSSYDVEGEVNGYLPYNRKPKIPASLIAEIHGKVLQARAAIHRDRAG